MNNPNISEKEDIFSEIEEVSDDISDVGLLDVPVLLIFLLLFFIVALQFFTRYVLNDSLGWTEEIGKISIDTACFCWICYLRTQKESTSILNFSTDIYQRE